MTTYVASTARTDQLAAATADAHHRLARVAAHHGAPLRLGVAPPWLVPHGTRLAEAITRRLVRYCPHIGSSPLVVPAAVWGPRHLVCSPCGAVLTPHAVGDATCARGRRRADPIYPGAIACGAVLLAFGLCRRCLNRTEHTSTRMGTRP